MPRVATREACRARTIEKRRVLTVVEISTVGQLTARSDPVGFGQRLRPLAISLRSVLAHVARLHRQKHPQSSGETQHPHLPPPMHAAAPPQSPPANHPQSPSAPRMAAPPAKHFRRPVPAYPARSAFPQSAARAMRLCFSSSLRAWLCPAPGSLQLPFGGLRALSPSAMSSGPNGLSKRPVAALALRCLGWVDFGDSGVFFRSERLRLSPGGGLSNRKNAWFSA